MSDARQLAKALNEIKATEFQFKAASILLAVNGLENALEFVTRMGQLNRGETINYPDSDNLRVCTRCRQYETTSPDSVCSHCKEQDAIDAEAWLDR